MCSLLWWAKSLQQHSCHNSSQQGSIIGGLHHVVDSSRLTKSQTGDIHHHVNPRCIDVARYARGSDHGEHPRSEDKPRKPPIESNRLGSISLGSISRALSDRPESRFGTPNDHSSADESAPGLQQLNRHLPQVGPTASVDPVSIGWCTIQTCSDADVLGICR